MIAAERGGGATTLRRLGDSILLLWALAGLAGGVPAVVLNRLSWGATAALNAGFAVAAIVLAMAVAAWRKRQDRNPLFLSPSVRQTCLLLIPLGLAVQVAVISWRKPNVDNFNEKVKEAQNEVDEAKQNQNQKHEGPAASKAAILEAIQTAAQSAPPEEQEKYVKVGMAIAETPPGQPLPPLEDLPIPEEWKESNGSTTGGGTNGAGAARSSPSGILSLLKLLTGPLRALLGALLGLGGGEKYRREATQIVLDLNEGRKPSPAAIASLLAKLEPEERTKARGLLQEFVEKQTGPDKLKSGEWRCAVAEGQNELEGASETVKHLTRILCRSPRTECPEIEALVLVGGEAFLSDDDKRQVLERLKEFGREDCGLSSKPVRGGDDAELDV